MVVTLTNWNFNTSIEEASEHPRQKWDQDGDRRRMKSLFLLLGTLLWSVIHAYQVSWYQGRFYCSERCRLAFFSGIFSSFSSFHMYSFDQETVKLPLETVGQFGLFRATGMCPPLGSAGYATVILLVMHPTDRWKSCHADTLQFLFFSCQIFVKSHKVVIVLVILKSVLGCDPRNPLCVSPERALPSSHHTNLELKRLGTLKGIVWSLPETKGTFSVFFFFFFFWQRSWNWDA